ncbi:MAG: Mur ligase domain-containing protein, partial [Rhodococcus sp. (in: high G+C Gram-positive bacteria)]|nr:Mur ligase domain-containing protein [Rhodococcus sp. (in: high G+C Gram-positive bacteria)]
MPNRLQSSNSDGAPGTRPTQPVATAITALSELSGARLEWVGQPGSQSSEVVVKGVDLRAQGIVADDLFAALPGARTHGAQFAVDALGRGATAILTD